MWLRVIMRSIHKACTSTAERFRVAGNCVAGAHIAGFLKVAGSMMDQGLV
jgi:glutamate dehydrogenase/leucine dehydrogenase